ncbi:MAG: hypothetical protein ACREDH_13550 [Methylocella sp.]
MVRPNECGAREIDGRYIRFGFKGCSDIIGQLTDGRFLAIEVKREDGLPTNDQVEFTCKVSRNNGMAFIARDVSDVKARLG